MEKEILAALEIADHEVRLLVGQFYNGRLNILKVEQVSHKGVSSYSIISENLVVEAILKAVENASRNLGVVIEKVLLVVPGIQTKHTTKQMQIPITGKVSDLDIKRAYRELIESKAMDDYVLTNVMMSKYFVNGSSTRKLPLNERCTHLTIEADCYYSRQSIIFPYLSAVEASGLKIIDIVLDDIGLAKEAALFESSIDKPIIVYTLARSLSKMTLYYKGKLLSTDYETEGLNKFLDLLANDLGIPKDAVENLLYYNTNLMEIKPKEDPIFIWSYRGQTHTVSDKDLAELLNDSFKEYLLELLNRSEPIFELGQPNILVTGSGSVIEGIKEFLEGESNAIVEQYRSMTFGIKEPSLSSVVGAFYYYKDQAVFRYESDFSANKIELEASILKDKDEHEDESMTQKLKKIFFEKV
ncbi:cell division protein FtsA [Erysipelothrix urinaevulpis]|uniref:cell division protein FtsA n=1 Tax=Erysipelothrix urinaevulpis TaxID=2683717 RepID=UPI001356878A|nr:cell division protein FtsA [Erysipelothrix urinaevulpis]